MKTPIQELFEYESDLTNMFDSDTRVAGAILEYIRTNKNDMLEKERRVIENAFLDGYTHSPDDGFPEYARNYYNETFNTQEK